MFLKKHSGLVSFLFVCSIFAFSLLNRQSYLITLWEGVNNFIIGCGDFGQYISETKDYLQEWVKLLHVMEVGKEPLFFLITSTYWRTTGLDAKESFIIMLLILKILIILWAYCIILNNTKNKVLSIAFSLLLCLSVVDSKGGFARQTLANFYIIFLCFSWILLEKKMKWGKVVMIFFLSWCFLAHKISFLYWSLAILISIFIYIINRFWCILKINRS